MFFQKCQNVEDLFWLQRNERDVDCETQEAIYSLLRRLQLTLGSNTWLGCFSSKACFCEWPDKRWYESKQRRRAQDSNHITCPWAICLCTLLNWIEPGMRLADIPSSGCTALTEQSRALWDGCSFGTVRYKILRVSYVSALQFHLADFIALYRLVRRAQHLLSNIK